MEMRVYSRNRVEYTSPIKLNICLLDEITLGVPGSPWCLFIYRPVSREGCSYIRKAMKHAVCHCAQEALITEVHL